MNSITKRLFLLSDEKYADFQAKLTPTVSRDRIIGVRSPLLKELAKDIIKEGKAEEFINSLPHKYYDENILHSAILSKSKDFDDCIKRTEEFLPFIDNWAVCDTLTPKILKRNKEELLIKIKNWIKSKDTYTCRFGIKLLMDFYLDEDYKKEYSDLVSTVCRDDYYVNMMVAWYFATALAKQYESAIAYLKNGVLPDWVHNKSIQKGIESYRLTTEQKEYIKSLKRKR